MSESKAAELRRKALRNLVKAAAGNVTVPAAEVLWLLDDCSRLQQSSDRLRRQNRKLRLRAGEAAEPDSGED